MLTTCPISAAPAGMLPPAWAIKIDSGSASAFSRRIAAMGPRTHPGHTTEEAADEESQLLDLPVNPDEGVDPIPDDELNPQVPS